MQIADSIEVALSFAPTHHSVILDDEELIREYAEECSIPELGEINPQRAIYDRMEDSGLMRTIGAFAEGKLVGFSTLLIFVLPHYGKKVANVESLFLRKSHRRGKAGLLLMSYVEHVADANLCSAVLYNVRQHTQFEKLVSILPGYKKTNNVYLRSL